MMSSDDNDGKDRLFSFRRQKISDAEIENQSFFRSTVVLEEELNSARLATRIYLSNLKRTNSSFDFLCILCLSSTAKNPTKSFIERAFANVRNKKRKNQESCR